MAVETNENDAKTPLEKLTKSRDPMSWLERLEMVVTGITYPFAHVVRVSGKIYPSQASLWARPNIALRLEVGGVNLQNGRPLTRVYTIRQFDEATCQMVLDFIIHEGDAPAMHWLDQAQVGTSIFLTGPRLHFVPDYSCAKNIAFFADDTAIPALYAILSQWPDTHQKGKQVCIYIDCADADYAHELPYIEGISYHIHIRDKGQMAGKSGYLYGCAKAISNRHDWQIWVACEREEARSIRQHFMGAGGLDDQDIKAVAYWKLGLSTSQLDEARLAYYAALHASGKAATELHDFDIPM